MNTQAEPDDDAHQPQALVDGVPADPAAEPQDQDAKGEEADKAEHHDDGVRPGGRVALVRDRQALRRRHGLGGAVVADRDLGRPGGAARRVHHVHRKGAVVEVHLERRVGGVGADLAVGPRGVQEALGPATHVDGPVAAAPGPAVGAPAQEDVAGVVDEPSTVEGLDVDVRGVDGLGVARGEARRQRHVVARRRRVRDQHEGAGHARRRAEPDGRPGHGAREHEGEVQVRSRRVGGHA